MHYTRVGKLQGFIQQQHYTKINMKENSQYKVLVIDDDHAVCTSIRLLLKKKGFHCDVIMQPALVLDKLNSYQPHLVILDMNFTIDTSGKQGLRLLKQIRENHPLISVILMTGWATVQLAVEGMKMGAKDFIAKPWDNKILSDSVKSILHIYEQNEGHVSTTFSDEQDSPVIIGKDPVFIELMDFVDRVAPTEASVLILGESGTGKELLAEAIHIKSQRKNNAFVKVNLGGISTSLFESEMFGHKKGAFTDAHIDRTGRFTLANNGTIFLDEIGELPLESQVKLLRVLQDKSYEILGDSKKQKSDFRVISATNKNLGTLVNNGQFREDLYYRINLITLRVPSLNERRTDIPLLINHFIEQICTLYKKEKILVETDALEWLSKLNYPGNIRELKNLVERTILLNFDKKELNIKDFKQTKQMSASPGNKVNIPEVGTVSLDEMEEKMIEKALSYHENNISKTAKSLGITRSALYRRIEKYNIRYES